MLPCRRDAPSNMVSYFALPYIIFKSALQSPLHRNMLLTAPTQAHGSLLPVFQSGGWLRAGERSLIFLLICKHLREPRPLGGRGPMRIVLLSAVSHGKLEPFHDGNKLFSGKLGESVTLRGHQAGRYTGLKR